MILKFVEGNCHCSFLNGIGKSTDDGMILGDCLLKVKNGKKSRTIMVVKQDKWYLHIPILIHEFAHYLVDLIFPFTGNNAEIISKHNIVEVIFDLNTLFNIKEETYYKDETREMSKY